MLLIVLIVGIVAVTLLAELLRRIIRMSSQLDQVLAADTATLTAIQALSTQLTTDVNTLIGLIQNGDPTALAAAQALGTNLTSLNTSLQSLDTSVQGVEGQPQTSGQPASNLIAGSSGTLSSAPQTGTTPPKT